MKLFYHTKINDRLQNDFLLFLGQNESKQTATLEGVINSLNSQVESARLSNEQQSQQVIALQTELEQYRQASEREINDLRNEINNLGRRRRPMIRRGGTKHPRLNIYYNEL